MEARSVNRPEAAAAALSAPPMSESEVRAAVEAEKLTLVPSTNKTGFKNVSEHGRRFQAQSLVGKKSYLGVFDTALEAALHVARNLGPAESARCAAPNTGMSEAAVHAAVEAERLTLVVEPNKTGFKGVVAVRKRFNAVLRIDGKRVYLGNFGSALEAALRVARHLGPEVSAAAAAAAAPSAPPTPNKASRAVEAALAEGEAAEGDRAVKRPRRPTVKAAEGEAARAAREAEQNICKACRGWKRKHTCAARRPEAAAGLEGGVCSSSSAPAAAAAGGGGDIKGVGAPPTDIKGNAPSPLGAPPAPPAAPAASAGGGGGDIKGEGTPSTDIKGDAPSPLGAPPAPPAAPAASAAAGGGGMNTPAAGSSSSEASGGGGADAGFSLDTDGVQCVGEVTLEMRNERLRALAVDLEAVEAASAPTELPPARAQGGTSSLLGQAAAASPPHSWWPPHLRPAPPAPIVPHPAPLARRGRLPVSSQPPSSSGPSLAGPSSSSSASGPSSSSSSSQR